MKKISFFLATMLAVVLLAGCDINIDLGNSGSIDYDEKVNQFYDHLFYLSLDNEGDHREGHTIGEFYKLIEENTGNDLTKSDKKAIYVVNGIFYDFIDVVGYNYSLDVNSAEELITLFNEKLDYELSENEQESVKIVYDLVNNLIDTIEENNKGLVIRMFEDGLHRPLNEDEKKSILVTYEILREYYGAMNDSNSGGTDFEFLSIEEIEKTIGRMLSEEEQNAILLTQDLFRNIDFDNDHWSRIDFLCKTLERELTDLEKEYVWTFEELERNYYDNIYDGTVSRRDFSLIPLEEIESVIGYQLSEDEKMALEIVRALMEEAFTKMQLNQAKNVLGRDLTEDEREGIKFAMNLVFLYQRTTQFPELYADNIEEFMTVINKFTGYEFTEEDKEKLSLVGPIFMKMDERRFEEEYRRYEERLGYQLSDYDINAFETVYGIEGEYYFNIDFSNDYSDFNYCSIEEIEMVINRTLTEYEKELIYHVRELFRIMHDNDNPDDPYYWEIDYLSKELGRSLSEYEMKSIRVFYDIENEFWNKFNWNEGSFNKDFRWITINELEAVLNRTLSEDERGFFETATGIYKEVETRYIYEELKYEVYRIEDVLGREIYDDEYSALEGMYLIRHEYYKMYNWEVDYNKDFTELTIEEIENVILRELTELERGYITITQELYKEVRQLEHYREFENYLGRDLISTEREAIDFTDNLVEEYKVLIGVREIYIDSADELITLVERDLRILSEEEKSKIYLAEELYNLIDNNRYEGEYYFLEYELNRPLNEDEIAAFKIYHSLENEYWLFLKTTDEWREFYQCSVYEIENIIGRTLNEDEVNSYKIISDLYRQVYNDMVMN